MDLDKAEWGGGGGNCLNGICVEYIYILCKVDDMSLVKR